MTDQRIEWLDMAKGLGIILVVLGHIYSGDSLRNVVIYSFHMPFFFFLAGYLYDATRYARPRDRLFRLVRGRIVPYISFFLISYVLLIIRMNRATGLSVRALISMDDYRTMVLDKVGALLYADGASLDTVGNEALWFLPCLFVTEVLFFLLAGKKGLRRPFIGAVLCASGGYLLSVVLRIDTPWSIETACIAVLFYFSGHAVRHVQKDVHRVPRLSVRRKAALAVVALCMTILLALQNGRVDMNSSQYGNIILFFAAAFSGICAMMLVSQALPAIGTVVSLGQNSLSLFGLHMPLALFAIGSIDAVASLFTNENVVIQDDLYVLLVACITLLYASGLVSVINRFFPFLIGKGARVNRQAVLMMPGGNC